MRMKAHRPACPPENKLSVVILFGINSCPADTLTIQGAVLSGNNSCKLFDVERVPFEISELQGW